MDIALSIAIFIVLIVQIQKLREEMKRLGKLLHITELDLDSLQREVQELRRRDSGFRGDAREIQVPPAPQPQSGKDGESAPKPAQPPQQPAEAPRPAAATGGLPRMPVTGAAQYPPTPPEAPSIAASAGAGGGMDANPPAMETKDSGGKPLEEWLGGSWSVWLGILALTLGGLFLVKYSIDAGLLGPGVRIILALVFAAALLALGEYARRYELNSPVSFLPSAHVPGALTASGTIIAYAAVLAAHALYGFIGAPLAFLGLVAISGATLTLALRHGPILAALGLLGAVAVPFLLGSGAPAIWLILAYYALLAATTCSLASARDWPWLGIGAMAIALAIATLHARGSILLTHPMEFAVYLGALMTITLVFLHHPAEHEKLTGGMDHLIPDLGRLMDIPATVFTGAAMSLVLAIPFVHAFSAASLLTAMIPIAFGAWLAWRYASLMALLPLAGALVLFILVSWNHLPGAILALPDRLLILPPQAEYHYSLASLALGGGLSLFALWAARDRQGQPLFAATGAATALLAFIFLMLRTGAFTHISLRGGLIALVLGVLFAAFAEDFLRQADAGKPHRRFFETSGSLLAATSVLFLALTLTLTLERGRLTIALALLTPAAMWIANMRNVRILRYLAVGVAALVVLRIVKNPAIMADGPVRTPIFNWLLLGYGVPMMAFWSASHLARGRTPPWAADMLESATLFFLGILVFLQIHALLNDGDIHSHSIGLAENATHTVSWLLLSIAQGWFARRSGRQVPRMASYIFFALTLFSLIMGQLFANNPLRTNQATGQGLLVLAYLAPALLLAAKAWLERDEILRQIAGGTALVTGLVWITLAIRLVFHPDDPAWQNGASQTEWISYSIAWLLAALALLAAGLLLADRELRLGGLVFLSLVVVKVFLSDMAHLGGVWRALSFIGLGLALLAIGWAYQRLILAERKPAPGPEPQAPGPDSGGE